MEYALRFLKLGLIESRRFLFVTAIVAVTVLVFRSLLLPFRSSIVSPVPDDGVSILDKINFSMEHSSVRSPVAGNFHLFNSSDLTDTSEFPGGEKNTQNPDQSEEVERDSKTEGKDRDPENDYTSEEDTGSDNYFELDEDRNPDDVFPSEKIIGFSKDPMLKNDENLENDSVQEKARAHKTIEQIREPSSELSSDNDGEMGTNLILEKVGAAHTALPSLTLLSASVAPLNKQVQCNPAFSNNNSALEGTPVRKKMRSEMPPTSLTSISEMNSLLIRRHASLHARRPRWSSVRDREILSVKSQIENVPIVKNDQDLYAPLFRNISRFKRSYELMERTLKVYIYREGQKPIFHQPILKGIYASEGWFMKLIVGNKRFVVKDPRKAHLFYMPFSSRMLEYTLYVRNSHNRTNLATYLKKYAELIAAKHPFWNRTGGADHFLVACHDWAPYETRHHMEHCLKALCNADVTGGFKIGRDVSLPETYVRSARNPLRDVGGKPPSERSILAFFAGNMHGYLRPILLRHWKNKDPDMKIFGPMPPGVASKMNYIHHMKSSKYCICAKGYEVNSPRVVEAIFYECVPVIISDNFVPPFFEVLNWEAFSVIIPEKDIPKLKDILLSIPEKSYLEMQLGVRKVQRHFLWHSKPIKYDIFHMTLHSIWYNRVFQIRPR